MRLKSFLRSGHAPTLFLSFLYFDVSFMVWVLVGVLGVFIAGDFGLSPGEKGFLVAVPILGGALARIPMGMLVDRIGPRRTGILGQLIVLLPLAWAWRAGGTLPQVLALGVLLGAAGGSFAVALPLAGRSYPPEHQGLAMGIAGAGNSGTVLAALFAPRLAEAFGWHAVFGLALIPAGLTLLLFALFVREGPPPAAPRPPSGYFRIWRERGLVRFCLLYGFTFGGFVGLASFLVIFFHDQYGLSRVTAGTLTAACVFAGSFMRPVGGLLSDRWGGWRILSVVLVMVSLTLGAVALRPPLAAGTCLLFVAMGFLGVGNGSLFREVPRRFAREIGAATGVIGAAGGAAGFLLPVLLGALRQGTGDYAAGFFLISLAGAYALSLLPSMRPAPPALAEAESGG